MFCFVFSTKAQQIVNYVNNGGFEECGNCPNFTPVLNAKYWNGIDTNLWYGLLLSKLAPSFQVPLSSYTYQWPRHGNNFLLSSLFIQPNSNSTRGYPRNKLKQQLQGGKTYCVKFYCNITNQSTYGVDAIGAFFGDESTDTISRCNKPISYLNPQIQNTVGNIISDTLNWVLISGTFMATGNEKFMILGNFKSDVATNSVLINPTNLPIIATEILYDDVSCIDIDLPAYAGPDLWCIPGDSVFIGRQPDVGIDEACMWYKLPNTTTPIDTVAGLWVKPNTTTSYMVRQEICGNVKWDLVTVYQSATGLQELQLQNQNLKLYPQPTQNVLNLSIEIKNANEFNTIKIYNSIGQLVKEEEVEFENGKAQLKTNDISEGIYVLKLMNKNSYQISKRFVIAR
jgi:hypothetical protein